MTALDIRAYATMKNDELVDAGIPARDATALREAYSGHRVRIGPRWAATIGHWGGVSTLAEIAELVEATPDYVKTYSRMRGLRYRTRKLQRTAAQLAALSLATLPGSAREGARMLGLYPAEVAMYRVAMSDLLTHAETPFHVALSWSPAELETRWKDGGYSLTEPRRFAFDLDEIVREAERRAGKGSSP